MADHPPPAKRSPASDLPALAIPDHIRATLKEGFLTSFEDAKAYEQLLLQIAQDVGPRGHIEWLWVKDVCDCTWDLHRARRAKAVSLAIGRKDAIRTIHMASRPQFELATEELRTKAEDDVEDTFERLGAGADPAEDGSDDFGPFPMMLHRLGLTEASLQDVAYSNLLPQMEVFDRLIDSAMARRDSVLREIDRRRDLGQRMRQAVEAADQVIDAEFE